MGLGNFEISISQFPNPQFQNDFCFLISFPVTFYSNKFFKMATKKATTGGAGNFRKMVADVREQGRSSIQTLLEKNPDKLGQLFSNDPLLLAELLSRASQDIVGGEMAKDEFKAFSDTFSRLPALSSKLLSGMGA